MAGPDPLAAELTDQLRILLEAIGIDAPADALSGFEDSDIPVGAP